MELQLEHLLLEALLLPVTPQVTRHTLVMIQNLKIQKKKKKTQKVVALSIDCKSFPYQISIHKFVFYFPPQLRRRRRKRRRRKSLRSLMTTWALVSLIKMDDFLRKHTKNIK